MNFSLAEGIAVWIYGYASVCGASMVAVGVSAANPTYDDTQSGAFRMNRMITIFTVVGATVLWFVAVVIRILPEIRAASFNPTYLPLAFVIMILPLPLVGLLTLYIGMKRLARQY
jgi:hypothetical protein